MKGQPPVVMSALLKPMDGAAEERRFGAEKDHLRLQVLRRHHEASEHGRAATDVPKA